MESIGTCRICGTGPVGLRKCGVCRRIVVLCDECDAAWPTADTRARPTYATEDDMPCPSCRASLLGSGSRWATKQDASAWREQTGVTLVETATEEPGLNP